MTYTCPTYSTTAGLSSAVEQFLDDEAGNIGAQAQIIIEAAQEYNRLLRLAKSNAPPFLPDTKEAVEKQFENSVILITREDLDWNKLELPPAPSNITAGSYSLSQTITLFAGITAIHGYSQWVVEQLRWIAQYTPSPHATTGHPGMDPTMADKFGDPLMTELGKLNSAAAVFQQLTSCFEFQLNVDGNIQRFIDAVEDLIGAVSPWWLPDAWNPALLLAQRWAAAVAPPTTVQLNIIPKEQILYREQCFLLANILELSMRNKYRLENLEPKKLPYQAVKNPSAAAAPATTPPATTPATNVSDSIYNTKSNACLLVDGNPYGFINRLTQYQSARKYFDLENHQISSLVPMIRLFKVSDDQNNQQEFNFHSNATTDDVNKYFKKKKYRGFGAGIKNFTFSYDGSNPFAVKKSIQAKLVIFANNFAELLRDRGGYRYVDLALKTGKGKSTKKSITKEMEENLSKLNFRLKAVVGWASPNNQSILKDKTVLNNSFVTLNLTPTIHEFDIDEMGRVTFTINYLAYIEDFFDQPSFNIFSDLDISLRQTKRKLQFKTLATECLPKEINDLKKEQQPAIQKEKEEGVAIVIRNLFLANRVKYISISRTELQSFLSEGPFYSQGALHDRIKDNLMDAAALTSQYLAEIEAALSAQGRTNATLTATQKASVIALDPESETLPFFYVSDLIDVILAGIDKKLQDLPGMLDPKPTATSAPQGTTSQAPASTPSKKIDDDILKFEIDSLGKFKTNYERFRVLLGPMEIVDTRGESPSKFVNLGDTPVSVKYFVEWLTEQVTKKDDPVYNLGQFLNDFFNNLIRNFFNDDTCFYYNAKQKIRLSQNALTSYPTSNKDSDGRIKDDITQRISNSTPKSRYIMPNKVGSPILNISGDLDDAIVQRPPANEINYFVFYAGRVQPTELMNGMRTQDEERGIFHYLLGKDRGVVKNISLEKTDSKYLKELRFEQEGYDGLEQLREVYDVKITAFPIVNAFPGTYIYVDPMGFAPAIKGDSDLEGIGDLTQYGIGGYHMIIRSEHSFGPGEAETNISAKWIAQIEHEADDAAGTENATKDRKGAGGKCRAQQKSREAASTDKSWLDDWTSFITGYKDDDVATPSGTGTP